MDWRLVRLGWTLLLVALAPGGVAGAGTPLLAAEATATTRPAREETAADDERIGRPDDPDAGADRLGRPAPTWTFDRWIGTRPLALEHLRGKVILLRWWTEDCRFCAHTLPALEQIHRRHGAEDLVVIGVYHPKPQRRVPDRHIARVARELGFSGPIAVDARWSTLRRYWLDGHPEHNWTSVSFLIDRDGVIRWVHGGGEYHESQDPRHAQCALELHGLEQALSAALAGSRPGSAVVR
jgi:thiol-disulfide isomerase/thioredoxin